MSRPNLLFLFPDQWRWDWLGCEASPYGKVPVRTPNIDALAVRGTRFTRCRTNSPLCSPARACLSLGVRYERCGLSNNNGDLDPSRPSLWKLLRSAGYRTLTCGKNDLHKRTTWKGRTGWTQQLADYGFVDGISQCGKLDAAAWGRAERGGPNCAYTSHLHAHGLFDTYRGDYERRRRERSHATADWASPLERQHYTDDFCGRAALDLLDRQPLGEPWMLWVNWPGPHDPFDPPAELRRRYDGVEFPLPVDAQLEATNPQGDRYHIDHQQIRRNYAAACEGIDEWVGRIIERVRQRGELERTVVVFASDHGEMLGDHGRFLKHVPHEGSVHVPLIVAGPGVPRGVVRHDLVELIDVAAELLRQAGVERPADWDALPLFGEDAGARDVQVSSLDPWRMICDGRFKLIIEEPDAAQAGRADRATLFDLASDAAERRDIASSAREVVDRLRGRLDRETRRPPASVS